MSATRTELAEQPCKFCAKPVGEEGAGSETCDRCWYGMRLDSDGWTAELKAEGHTPPIYRGGCITTEMPDGGAAIMCRDPYAPGFKVVP